MTDISAAILNESDFQAVSGLNRQVPCSDGTISPEIENILYQMAIKNPSLGQYAVSDLLRERGIVISPGKVRAIWKRHRLETCDKRLTALARELITARYRENDRAVFSKAAMVI